jgi:hypothetical protein
MVLTSAAKARSLRSWVAFAASCPPLFLWQREGFREHAVALSRPMGEVVGGCWQDRSLQFKEIGYGQQ